MENFSDFDDFVFGIQNPSPEPKTVEEIAKARGITGDLAVQACRQLQKDASKPIPVDPLDVEQCVMQQRIMKAISAPTEAGQAGNAASGMRLTKGSESEPVHDSLMELLDLEREPEPQTMFHRLESVPAGRVPLAPGPSFAKRAVGTASFLDRPTPDVFEAIAERCSGRVAEFARSLGQQARALEVLS